MQQLLRRSSGSTDSVHVSVSNAIRTHNEACTLHKQPQEHKTRVACGSWTSTAAPIESTHKTAAAHLLSSRLGAQTDHFVRRLGHRIAQKHKRTTQHGMVSGQHASPKPQSETGHTGAHVQARTGFRISTQRSVLDSRNLPPMRFFTRGW